MELHQHTIASKKQNPKHSFLGFGFIFYFTISQCVLFSSSVRADDYIVIQPGQILTRIARQQFGAPTYSDQGAYARLLKLNPEIKNPESVHAGLKIRISNSSTAHQPNQQPIAKSNNRSIASDSNSESSSTVKRGGILIPQIAYQFSRIDSRDNSTLGRASLVSTTWLDFSAQYRQRWTQNFSTFARFRLAQTTFESPKTKTLTNASNHLFGFGMGVRFFESGSHRVEIQMGVDQQPFTYALTATAISLGAAAIPSFQIKTEHDLVTLDPFFLGISANGSVQMPGKSPNFTAKTGYQYGGAFYLGQCFDSSKLNISVFYDQFQQNTDITQQSRTDMGIGVQYQLQIGQNPIH
jgi:hypothetical protein